MLQILHYLFHPSAGVALALLMVAVIVAAAIHTPKAEAAQALAPEHSCVVDLDRSTIAVHDNDTITATCAIAGCHRVMVLGHNIANAYMVVH